jgi:NAD(P)-dependent dehydrogenase (short-subunit alcohol dehydrogenase family)
MSVPAAPVVAVTGASAGIGRATVCELARRRARLGLVARGRDGLEAAAREVEAAGGHALVLPGDVADPAVLEDAAAQTEGAFGPLDAWINNAMVSVFGLVFYNGAGFPERYRGGAFVAQRGSWNRSRFSGYRVVFVPSRDGTPAGPPEDFLTGERTGIRDHARAGQIRSANLRTPLGARPRTACGRRRAARPTLEIGHVHELADRR